MERRFSCRAPNIHHVRHAAWQPGPAQTAVSSAYHTSENSSGPACKLFSHIQDHQQAPPCLLTCETLAVAADQFPHQTRCCGAGRAAPFNTIVWARHSSVCLFISPSVCMENKAILVNTGIIFPSATTLRVIMCGCGDPHHAMIDISHDETHPTSLTIISYCHCDINHKEILL